MSDLLELEKRLADATMELEILEGIAGDDDGPDLDKARALVEALRVKVTEAERARYEAKFCWKPGDLTITNKRSAKQRHGRKNQ